MGPEGWAALISAGALIFGILTWRSQNAERRRDAILAQAIRSLENAYGTLTDNGTEIPPPRGRLRWLTTARHILRYQELRKQLTSYHELICEEQEEHWRNKFYRAVAELADQKYYFGQARDPAGKSPPPIELRSAVVVLAFADWPKGKADPIDDVNVADLLGKAQIVSMRYLHLDLEIKAYEERHGSLGNVKTNMKSVPTAASSSSATAPSK